MIFVAQVTPGTPPALSADEAAAPAEDIREIAPPVPIVDHRDGLALGIICAIGAIAVGLVLWRTAFAHRRPTPPALPSDPQTTAIAELVSLETQGKESGLSLAETAKASGEILARYLHRTTGAPALYRTASELTRTLPSSGAPPVPALVPYTEILAKLEEARFAPGSTSSASELIDSVRWAITSNSDAPPPLPN